MAKLNKKPIFALVFALFCLGNAPSLWAQQSQWAVKMFSETGGERVHDFGSVALHATVEHRFQFKNIYKEDVVISSVASNCGCTHASAPKQVIRSGEIGEIVARVDTSGREHTKSRKATITVLFSKPAFAEVQLQIKTYIRSDVGFEPGSIAFGTVAQGKSVVKKAYLQYEGRPNWALVGIQKSNPGVRAEAREVRRQGGSVVYEILVELKADAAPGYLHDLLHFKTNDPDAATSSVFLPIDALVTAPLAAKPSYLQLGVVQKNQTITKNLVVCGSTPFKILSVGSNDARLSFLKTDLSRTVHVVPVTFRAGEEIGAIDQSIFISTSQPNQNQLCVAATGFVVDADQATEKKMLDSAPTTEKADPTPSRATGVDAKTTSVAEPLAPSKPSETKYAEPAQTVFSTEASGPATNAVDAPTSTTPAPTVFSTETDGPATNAVDASKSNGGWTTAPATTSTPPASSRPLRPTQRVQAPPQRPFVDGILRLRPF